MTTTRTNPARRTRRTALLLVAALVGAVALVGPGASVASASGGSTSISAGNAHTCSVMADTSARCWGANSSGQLGSDSGTAYVPVPVTSTTGAIVTGIKQISAGGGHTCAVFSNGTARCWGANDSGQLGDGSNVGRSHPVFVRDSSNNPLTGIASITTGFSHSCAKMVVGTVRCWGANAAGQLGDGTTTNRNRPVEVTTAASVALTGGLSVVAGAFHTCALLSNGTAKCWGNNANGQIGNGSTTNQTRAVSVLNTNLTAMSGVTGLAAGDVHTCARLNTGNVRCWGWNFYGQIGDGSTTDRYSPVFVRNADNTPLGTVTSITGGSFHTCARLSTGAVRCWGFNTFGQLGDGTTINRNRPVAATVTGTNAALTGVTNVTAGNGHTCVRMTTGQARCWGANNGQVGDGTTTNRPRAVVVVGGPLTGVA